MRFVLPNAANGRCGEIITDLPELATPDAFLFRIFAPGRQTVSGVDGKRIARRIFGFHSESISAFAVWSIWSIMVVTDAPAWVYL